MTEFHGGIGSTEASSRSEGRWEDAKQRSRAGTRRFKGLRRLQELVEVREHAN